MSKMKLMKIIICSSVLITITEGYTPHVFTQHSYLTSKKMGYSRLYYTYIVPMLSINLQ